VYLIRAGPRVADNESAVALGVWSGKAGPDRTTPVINHQSNIAQVERHEELLQHAGVLTRLEAVARARRAESKSWVVCSPLLCSGTGATSVG
jgi:hypothetical protein